MALRDRCAELDAAASAAAERAGESAEVVVALRERCAELEARAAENAVEKSGLAAGVSASEEALRAAAETHQVTSGGGRGRSPPALRWL